MNITGALKKAKEVLGKTARVERRKCYLRDVPNKRTGEVHCAATGHYHPCPGKVWECVIGRIEMGMFFAVRGAGRTWEEAFARFEHSDHRDYCRKRLFDKPCRKCDKLKAVVDGFRPAEMRKTVIL